MTIEFMDNFSVYGIGGEAQMLNGLYAQIGIGTVLVADPSGVAGVTLLSPNLGDITFRRVLGGTRTRVGVASRIWCTQLPNTNHSKLIVWADAGNNTVCELRLLTTGALQFRHGPSLASAITTPGPVIVANAWQHVEALLDHNAATGAIEVRVEGVAVLTGSALNTGTGSAQISDFIQPSGLETLRVYRKDLIVYNGLGSQNNNFIGACIVASLDPSSDVALNWTPSTGTTGFSILDNRPPNDAQFISAGDPPPAAYEAGLTNLPPDVTSVRALQSVVRAAKVDGGDGNLQVSLVSGVSVSNGADRPITSAFTYWFDVFEVDPATSAPWTPSAVDAVQMRINRTV